ncbi:hypothetical protein [Motiliproteus sp. MSK22-1]|uniref:hypothetical protein n=1 Tax=Motiliproteus sp. MSK22-1 TaxID=1897630 RepID=UPI0009767A67|nr:hypothetical protein [Motiliproteus sp. MSK22-1]OMH38746.1 hypothetical protein BGP75_06040 [Motiliproteus sp. MSK22-1]
MDRKIVLGLIAISTLAIIIAISLPGGRKVDSNPKLPWQITTDADGNTSVFGLTLGKSTLKDAELSFENAATLSLFRTTSGEYSVEAYFDRIYLSGLKANLVLTLEVSAQQAQEIFSRGIRISQLGDGSKKVEISEEDKQHLGGSTIDLITYLPAADLEAPLIAKHFGIPDRKIAEGEHLTHWLYPDKGLDITVNSDGKEVFQYLTPSEFQRVISPLEKL